VTATQIDDFFQGYAAAFSRFDVDEVCRLWAYPAYFAYGGQRAALDAHQFRANTEQLCRFYRAQGMARATKRVLDVHPLTETTASVRTADEILGAQGEIIVAWEHAYVLSETVDGIRVVAALPDAELEAWRAKGAVFGRTD
jgi:hypothetical protein